MNHILLSNRTANLINYMTANWGLSKTFEQAEFLGFYPITGNYTTWGINLDGEDFAAMHVFKTKEGFFWGDDLADTAEHAASSPWVLMFYGTDNSSCFLRFPTRDGAMKWIAKNKTIETKASGVMFYNS